MFYVRRTLPRNINMDFILRISTLYIMSAWLLCKTSAETRVTLTVPVPLVKEQGMLSLKCQVYEADDSHRIQISRRVGGKTEIVSMNGEVQKEVDERFFLAERRLDDSLVHFLSVINAGRDDEGMYFCNVFQLSDRGFLDVIATASERIEISFFPADIYPECSPTTGTLIEGNTIVLNCSSEDSNQLVDISWKRTSRDYDVLKTEEITRRDGVVFKELHLPLKMSDKQTVFLCEITHPLFPGEVQSCHIGPLSVIANPMAKPDSSNDLIPTRKDTEREGNENVHSTDDKTKFPEETAAGKAENCNDVCNSFSSSSGLSYWVIATIGACFIALFFLCIGIVLAVKLHKRMNALPPSYQYNQDDIYSEIHSRRDNNRLYMTLAKIDNPINPANQPNWELEGNYTGTPIAIKP